MQKIFIYETEYLVRNINLDFLHEFHIMLKSKVFQIFIYINYWNFSIRTKVINKQNISRMSKILFI